MNQSVHKGPRDNANGVQSRGVAHSRNPHRLPFAGAQN